MSNSSSGEKTEQPTPKKRRDARKKGQVAKSTEVVTTVSLFSVIAFLWLSWDGLLAALIALFDLVAAAAVTEFDAGAVGTVDVVAGETALILLPVLGVVLLAGIAANYFQIGALMSAETIKPKLEKISPAAGFKRIFSMRQLVETLKSIVKIIVLSVLLYFVVRNAIGAYIASVSCGLPCLSAVTAHFMMQTFIYSALAFIAVALADIAYQRRAHTKSLMMTKDEVKREYKESEGDPQIKGRRRQLAQQLIMGSDAQAARKGTAVVVNPTHFAVVILYIPDKTPLPVVTAKGRNRHAHFLRAEAEAAGVPIFRNVALARALFADVEVDGFIPDDLFDVVAEVLSWVERHRDRLYKGRLDHGVLDMAAGDHRADVSRQDGGGPDGSGPDGSGQNAGDRPAGTITPAAS